jgi:hypothetical protein
MGKVKDFVWQKKLIFLYFSLKNAKVVVLKLVGFSNFQPYQPKKLINLILLLNFNLIRILYFAYSIELKLALTLFIEVTNFN